MAGRKSITAKMLDGSEHRVPETTSFLCTADRVAFEKRFQTGSGAFAGLQRVFDEDGELKEGADTKELGMLRDEWLAFFAWRVLSRSNQGVPAYDDFIENIEDLEIRDLETAPLSPEETEAANPTVVAPLPG